MEFGRGMEFEKQVLRVFGFLVSVCQVKLGYLALNISRDGVELGIGKCLVSA